MQSSYQARTMVQVVGNYPPNGQYYPVQNHGYYPNSPTTIPPQEFFKFHPVNYHKQRVPQQGPYPFDGYHQFNARMQSPGMNRDYRETINYAPMNSPNGVGIATNPQKLNTAMNYVGTPVHQPYVNYNRPVFNGNVKKQCLNNNYHNNKLSKRHSFQDLSSLKETCNNSDSGFSSRSPTPNKCTKVENNHTESSDEQESLSSTLTDQNKHIRHSRSNLSDVGLPAELFPRNLFQNHRQSNESINSNPRAQNQMYSNRRKYPTARGSPTNQRYQRGKKYNDHFERGSFPKMYSPADRFIHRSYLIQIRQKPSNLLTGSKYDLLSKAIWEKFEKNQPSQTTYCQKMLFWRYLFGFIKSRFPYYGLFMVGSTLNGFGTDTSDVDMCLLVRETTVDPRTEAIYRLGQIMALLKKNEWINHLELIQAKVPILKIREKLHNIEVDLNYNNAVGIRNTHLLYCYSQIDWRVRPLVLIVKMWAQHHNINDARHMTISSYSLVLMVIHFLQCGVSPSVLPCLHSIFHGKFHPNSDVYSIDVNEDLRIPEQVLYPFNKQTLGELLIDFFKYYDSFDFDNYAISIRVAGKLEIESCKYVRAIKNDPHQWKYLCIEEPFDFTNTARSVYDPDVFKKIKTLFNEAYQGLRRSNNLKSIFRKFENSL